MEQQQQKKARRASSVCMRGTTSVGASEERRARGGAKTGQVKIGRLDDTFRSTNRHGSVNSKRSEHAYIQSY